MTARPDLPVIETNRLTLSPPDGRDLAALLAFFASERSVFYRGPISAEEAWDRVAGYSGQWALRGYGFFALRDRQSGATVGLAGPHQPGNFPEPEMSWLLVSADHEGRGLAREGCVAVLRHLFDERGWPSLVSYIDPANTASEALARRIGAVPDPDAEVPLPGCVAFRHTPGGLRP